MIPGPAIAIGRAENRSDHSTVEYVLSGWRIRTLIYTEETGYEQAGTSPSCRKGVAIALRPAYILIALWRESIWVDPQVRLSFPTKKHSTTRF